MEEQRTQDQAIEQVLEPINNEEQSNEEPTEQSREEPQAEEKNPQASFRELRAKAERFAKERDELAQKISHYEQERSKPAEEEPNYADDDLLEMGTYKKLRQKERQELDKLRQELTQLSVEARLKAQFPDFDEVVTSDSVEALAKADPETAQLIRGSSDLYLQAAAAYKNIKKHGLGPNKAMDNTRKRAEDNLKKPQVGSMQNTHAQNPSTFAFAEQIMNGEMTPEMEQRLRDEIENNRMSRKFSQ